MPLLDNTGLGLVSLGDGPCMVGIPYGAEGLMKKQGTTSAMGMHEFRKGSKESLQVLTNSGECYIMNSCCAFDAPFAPAMVHEPKRQKFPLGDQFVVTRFTGPPIPLLP